MDEILRFLFHLIVVKPLALIVLGLNVRRRELLPKTGPSILVANHNSHLDTVVLMSLFPYRLARLIRPVAAADYFLRNRLLAWFALTILRIIPVDRTARHSGVGMLDEISQSLERGEIILLFPEGSRGEAERLGQFKSGIAHIAKRHADIPAIPIFVHGAGKALPRGEAMLVPFFCDIFISEPVAWEGSRELYMKTLEERFQGMAQLGDFPPWL